MMITSRIRVGVRGLFCFLATIFKSHDEPVKHYSRSGLFCPEEYVPSFVPSASPSMSPSNKPTVSTLPSSEPSSVPSNEPTYVPSNEPTGSTLPSNEPSSVPSNEPTYVPSNEPTASTLPSSEPSSVPSNEPTYVPSNEPTGSTLPSSEPTSIPSNEPSREPSTSPSKDPASLFIDSIDLCNRPTEADIRGVVMNLQNVTCPLLVNTTMVLTGALQCQDGYNGPAVIVAGDSAVFDCDGHVVQGPGNPFPDESVGILLTGNEAGVTGCSITGFLAGIHIAGTNTNVDSVNLYGNFDGLEIFPVATGGLITESFFINNEDSGIVSKANGLGGNTITRSYIDTLDQPCQAFVVTEVTADILIEDTAVLGNPHAVGFAFRGREMGSSVRLKNVISCF